MKEKQVVLLGATGSIGRQTLEVVRAHPHLKLVGASAHRDLAGLRRAVLEHSIPWVCVSDPTVPRENIQDFLGDLPCKILYGKEGLKELAAAPSDIVLTAVVGLSGLEATLAALEAGRDIALANKETLVGAGALVMAKAKARGASIRPVDSEHSAIFQALQGSRVEDIERLILTASGGPFRGKKTKDLQNVTPKEALAHPQWTMGAKVSVDSATLMNKGLEVIEAHWLFCVAPERIAVHVHPQSIVHSAVEFCDHSILAQLGTADMRLPIQYALNYPERLPGPAKSLDLIAQGTLSFEAPDESVFPCLPLAYEALRLGGYTPLVLNTADEVAVELFLKEQLPFLKIPQMIEFALGHFHREGALTLEGILDLDETIRRELARAFFEKKS
ncbi:1-deoxy-D-xylulose 5-phosphate reductoisomerase [Clostridiaceae bacterium JG1575]|nr:1-deoxy-D-xylulose 5-phosphate reductoisomerase [Clostridiaceae bacterium JG1575]